ncbi:GH25 family lysozyme, partial [Dactylosporangium sp. NPDC006015]
MTDQFTGSRRRSLRTLLVPLAASLAIATMAATPAAAAEPNGHAAAGRVPGTAAPPSLSAAAVPPGYPITGVDVSNHQGGINWSSVAGSGQRFMYAKASEGLTFTDSYFAANYANAKANGLYAGAYHFARPDRGGGTAQADYFLDRARYAADGRTLPPMLDIEWPWEGSGSTYPCYGMNPGQMVAWVNDFVTRVRERTGRPTMIYTSASWWNPCTGNSGAFADQPLFVARYASAPGTLPAGWSRWALWQYTDQASVPGVSGNVDHNVFNGSTADLADLAGGTAAVSRPRPGSGLVRWGDQLQGFERRADNTLQH